MIASKGTRLRRWKLFVLVSPLVLLVAYFAADMWTGRRVNQAAARFDARYGGLSIRHLTTAPVPAANNRARLVRAASALTVPMSPAAATALKSVTRTSDMTPVPAELRAFVEANKRAVSMLADAGLRAESSWEIEYVDPSNAPPFMELRLLGQAVYVAALLEIEGGRPDEAAKYIASGLAMAASLRQEPNLVAQLIRIAITFQQFDVIQRLITHTEVSKTSLDELARRLEENRSPDPMRVGLLSEVRMGHAMLTRLEQGRVEDGLPGPGPSPWSGPRARLLRPFVRIAHASYLEHVEQLLEWQGGPRPRSPFKQPGRLPLVGSLIDGLIAALERSVVTGDDFNSVLGATQLAVALRRHRVDRGVYPDDLAALAPAYLSAIPVNPFTGKPPVYAQKAAGFTLTAPQSRTHVPASPPTPEWTVNR